MYPYKPYEAKMVENNVKTIAHYLNIALRYLASGLVFVLIWFSLYDKDKIQRLKSATENETLILCSCAVLGVIIYSIHISTIDRRFYKLSMLKYIRKNGMPQFMKDRCKFTDDVIVERIKNIIPFDKKVECLTTHKNEPKADAIKLDLTITKDSETGTEYCDYYFRKNILGVMIFELYTQSFLRLASNDSKIKILADEMDDRYAMLAFMYCIFYACILVSIGHFLLLVIPTVISKGCIQLKDVWQYIAFFVIGFFFLCVAQKFSYRLLRREIWIIETYKQGEHDLY